MQKRVTSRGDIDKWTKLAETSKHLTGKLMATSLSIPGFGEFLLSHSHAVYYSPSQWCSVGHVIHNVRFPNLKQISYGVMGIALRFITE